MADTPEKFNLDLYTPLSPGEVPVSSAGTDVPPEVTAAFDRLASWGFDLPSSLQYVPLESLQTIVERSLDPTELVELVYQAVETNNYLDSLIDNAVSENVLECDSPTQVLQADHISTSILRRILLNSSGSKFLLLSVAPFVRAIAGQSEESLQLDINSDLKQSLVVSYEANVANFCLQIGRFLQTLRSNVLLCPLHVRQLFCALSEAVEGRFGRDRGLDAVVQVFIRTYLYPALLRPDLFGILPAQSLTSAVRRALTLAWETLCQFTPAPHPELSFANNPIAYKLVADFVATNASEMKEFAATLIDADDLRKLKGVIDAAGGEFTSSRSARLASTVAIQRALEYNARGMNVRLHFPSPKKSISTGDIMTSPIPSPRSSDPPSPRDPIHRVKQQSVRLPLNEMALSPKPRSPRRRSVTVSSPRPSPNPASPQAAHRPVLDRSPSAPTLNYRAPPSSPQQGVFPPGSPSTPK